jgi:hypothetical protein
MSVGIHVKCPLFLSYCNKILSYFDRFSKSTEMSNLMEIQTVEAKLFDADRVTDRHDEANRRYSHFCERPPKRPIVIHTNQELYSNPARIVSFHHKRCFCSFVLFYEIHTLCFAVKRRKCCCLPMLLHIGLFQLGIYLFDIKRILVKE